MASSTKMKVVKWCNDAVDQVNWFKQLDCVPQNVELRGLESYCYDYVYGHMPRVPPEHGMFIDNLWEFGKEFKRPYLEMDRQRYYDHFQRVALSYDIEIPAQVKHVIMNAALTPVRQCHGDLTFANMIQRNKEMPTLIDPGRCWGLPCRELDEAKMLQSHFGFEFIQDSGLGKVNGMYGFAATEVHYALLFTHLVRLLPHWPHGTAVYRWARGLIKEFAAGRFA